MVTSKDQKPAGISALDILPKVLGSLFWNRYDIDCPDRCICNNQKGVRCGRRMGNGKPLRSQMEYSRLRTLCPVQDSSASLEAINAFIMATCCLYHNETPKMAARQWFATMTPSRPKTKSISSSPKTAPSTTAILISSSRSEANTKTPPKPESNTKAPPKPESNTKAPSKTYGLRSDPETRSALRNMNLFDLHDPVWERYKKTKWDSHAIYSEIRETLMKPLTKDTREGQLYCYTTKSFPDYVKIGMTGRDANIRIREWTNQCQRRADLSFATMTHVHAVRRLEALVFAELAPYRVRERECPGCRKTHIEWFRVSPKHAKMVAFKWSAFMETRPYVFENDGWWLDPALARDEELLERLCTPIDPTSTADMCTEDSVGHEVAAARQRSRPSKVKEMASSLDVAVKPVEQKKDQDLVRIEHYKPIEKTEKQNLVRQDHSKHSVGSAAAPLPLDPKLRQLLWDIIDSSGKIMDSQECFVGPSISIQNMALRMLLAAS